MVGGLVLSYCSISGNHSKALMFHFSFLLLQLVRNMHSLNEQSIAYLEGLQCSFSASYEVVLGQNDMFAALEHCLAG